MTARQLAAVPALVLVLALAPHLAAAEPHKVLVLQSEGRADRGLRARIDAALVQLANTGELQATPGELTFTDAATAVGCRPDAPGCKDQVLDMLAVDEIVITTVSPKPGGVEIAAQRFAKGGVERDATMLLASGAPADKLDGLAPLFRDQPMPPPSAPPPAPAAVPAPAPGTAPPAPAIAASPPPAEPAPVVPAPARITPSAAMPETTPSPAAPADQPAGHDRGLEIAGMAGGSGLATLGLVLWAAANSTQHDIDIAPTRTSQDLAHLKDLESRGDTYAALGNVLVATGAIVGGLATYLYIKDRRSGSTATARIVPTVLDHGAGVVLAIGGIP